MELIGFIDSITTATFNIDSGRKGFATRGKEHEGRLSYERGIFAALSAFKETQTTADPQTMTLTEYTFLSQEFEFCEKSDKDSLSSLTQALQSFDDAFLALTVVEDNILYQVTEKTFPHHKKYRVKGYPKDSFHIACESHKARLKNILRAPGIDPIEKALLKQLFTKYIKKFYL